MTVLQYFPDEMLALQVEISYHPKLQGLLICHSSADFVSRIAEIATYCEVLLDGYYDEEEIKNICTILRRKLQEKRISIMLPH